MSHLSIALLSLAGFTGLALASQRQQEELTGGVWPGRLARVARVSGWATLATALWVAVGSGGWAFGLVTYAGHTSLATGAVGGGLVLAKRLLRHDRERQR